MAFRFSSTSYKLSSGLLELFAYVLVGRMALTGLNEIFPSVTCLKICSLMLLSSFDVSSELVLGFLVSGFATLSYFDSFFISTAN